MHPARRRQYVLAGTLAVFLALTAVVLWEVVETVFFAVTVAYILVPVRTRLVERGFSARLASAVVATGALAVAVVVVAAFGYLLYERGRVAIDLVRQLPDTFTISLGGMSTTIELRTVMQTGTGIVQDVAAAVASAVPVLALKLLLFAILIFGLLLHPGATGRVVFRLVPESYHDVVVALDDRIRHTLYGIYVLQAATAFGTAVVALIVFAALGYEAVFTLAIAAGILQFIPVLGPSVLLVALAAVDAMTGDPTRAALVLVVGGALIAAAPDAVIRPRLASWAADLPTTLYFIGFVGGVLTVGPIGFIAGPLAVALVVEVVGLLSDGRDRRRGGDEPSDGEEDRDEAG
jgi:predicted PurR-regulated permease PerM